MAILQYSKQVKTKQPQGTFCQTQGPPKPVWRMITDQHFLDFSHIVWQNQTKVEICLDMSFQKGRKKVIASLWCASNWRRWDCACVTSCVKRSLLTTEAFCKFLAIPWKRHWVRLKHSLFISWMAWKAGLLHIHWINVCFFDHYILTYCTWMS